MANNGIKRKNWTAAFELVGEARVGDYTYKIDAQSEKSNWIYNSMSLAVDCGEKHGIVNASFMGGYSGNGDSVIYVHGIDPDREGENFNDDFDNRFTVAWDDRFNEEILATIGSSCFFTVGLEKTTDGKTYYKKFLSQYDAIAYIREHLTSGTVLRVRGQLKYNMYNDTVRVQKDITSIVLSGVDDPSKYKATFTQSVILDGDSATLKEIDKDKGVMFVTGRVLDYVKELNGVEIRGQYPYYMNFEYKMNFDKPEQCKKIYEKLFKIKKGVNQINFNGEFIESGATVTATLDDLSDEVKELLDMGMYTEKEALAACTTGGSKERRMVLINPILTRASEDKPSVPQIFEGQYTEEELAVVSEVVDDGVEAAVDNMDWLADL